MPSLPRQAWSERSDWSATWDFRRIPEADQLPAWRETLDSAFGPLTAEPSRPGPFPTFIGHRAAGPIGLFHIQAPVQDVRLSAGNEDGGVAFLNLMLRGAGTASQDGRTAQQRPHGLFLLDSRRPFHKHFSAEFEQLCFTLPLDLLAARLADPTAATAAAIPGESGVGAILAATLRGLAAEMATLDNRAAEAVVASLVDLLTLCLGRAGSRSGGPRRALLRQAAFDALEGNLADPDLAPDRVARQIGVSTRHLHQLFADHGTSFGRHLLHRRLERARRDLDDVGCDHLTIATIATHWGFAAPTHFARAFRARYGESPSEHRRARRERAAARGPAR